MIYLLRHGETVWNRAGRLQGRADSPLTLAGARHAMAYGSWLAGELAAAGDVVLYSSPIGRARQTAAIVADAIGYDAQEIVLDDRLAEHDVGELSGSTWAEIERSRGERSERLRDWDYRPPGGETRREMLARVEDFLGTTRAEPVSIVVSHGGTSRALRGAFLGLDVPAIQALPVHAHGRLFALSGGRVTECVVDAAPPPPEELLG